MISKDDVKIAIIGLGYVGLPLAAEFGKIRQVVGFDVNHKRILELKEGIDVNLETTEEELRDARHLTFTSSIDEIRECNFYSILLIINRIVFSCKIRIYKSFILNNVIFFTL